MVEIGQGLIPDYVSIERKSVKHLRLVVNRDGTVRLVLPTRVSLKAGIAFYQERAGWVTAKRAQLQQQQTSAQQEALREEADTASVRGW